MIELINFLTEISKEAWQVVVIMILLAFCILLVKILFNSFKEKLDDHLSTTAHFSSEVQGALTGMKHDIEQHKDSMGKATKAINGDFLRIKESILDLREAITKESSEIKKQTLDLKTELSISIEKSKFISESVTEKTGKIILVEQNMSKVLNDTKKHEEIIGKIIRVVNTNVTDIKSLKSK